LGYFATYLESRKFGRLARPSAASGVAISHGVGGSSAPLHFVQASLSCDTRFCRK
jgi:hypothetical protein